LSVTFGNEFLGLSEGPENNKATSVINALCGDDFLVIGDVVKILPIGSGTGFTPVGSLLPRVGIVPSSGNAGYGVTVGGNKKGTFQTGFETRNSAEDLALGIVAGLENDSLRICTQGICLAKIISRTGTELQVGTALTPDRNGAVSVNNFGTFKEAGSGDEVLARLLQIVPSGTAGDSKIRIAAVNLQREGKFFIFAFKKELTIEAVDVTGASPLVDFPLLVSITDTDLRDNVRSDGFDIRFTDSNGVRIPYEREAYDNSTGELVAWVLTDLSDTVDNKIFMVYGSPNATDQQNPLPVWNTRFQDIFHYNQTLPLPWVNSSVGKDFTIAIGDNSVPVFGQIDTASDISVFDAPNQVAFRMASGGSVSPTDFFASAWVKFDTISTEAGTFLNCWESQSTAGGPTFSVVSIGSGVQGSVPDNEKIELIITDQNLSVLTEILIGDMVDLAFHHIAVRYTSGAPGMVLLFQQLHLILLIQSVLILLGAELEMKD